jgi:hypothetical protein
MNKIDKVIEYFRNLREENGAPTMNTGTPNGSAGLSANADASGPNAGNTYRFPRIDTFRRKRNGKIDGRSASNKYKKWLESLGLL